MRGKKEKIQEIYGIIAHPVKHSLSPGLFAEIFRHEKRNAAYCSFDVPTTELEKSISDMREYGHRGYSVSLPHKTEVMKYLDELSPLAGKIGAVNTIINHNGHLLGDNTDYGGFKMLLSEQGVTDGGAKSAVVLGAGGASRAIIACLLDSGFSVLIVVRDPEKAKESLTPLLFHSGGVLSCMSFEDLTPELSFSVLVNTTPVGMHPGISESLISDKKYFQRERLFVDIVYTPRMTALLKLAAKYKCRIATGDRMFLWQAARQYELWTGKKAPLKVMEAYLKKKLKDD